MSALGLGAYCGQTATINGGISISNSQNVMLYGLNVTNPSGNGISVSNSRSVDVDACTSNGNVGVGLSVYGMSDVTVGASGAFDHNSAGGMNIGGNSFVSVDAWAGGVDISNNGGPGVWASQANFATLGSTTITNNVFGPGSSSGFGIDLRGGAHAQIGAILGQNVISGNQSGGAWLNARSAGIRVDGNSEVYLRGGQVTQNNGPGILALVNSSGDFTGVSFSGNLTLPNSPFFPAGVVCKTPHALGNRANLKALPPTPDWSAHKALYDKYAKTAVKH